MKKWTAAFAFVWAAVFYLVQAGPCWKGRVSGCGALAVGKPWKCGVVMQWERKRVLLKEMD